MWTWSKVVRRVALAADVPRFSTHTTRHLCLTDLARMGWELHAIATFAGHRSHRVDAAVHPPVRAGSGGEAEPLHGAHPCVAHRHAHRHPESDRTLRHDRRRVSVAGRRRTRAGGLGVFRWTAAGTAGSSCSTARPRRCSRSGPAGLRRNRAVGIPATNRAALACADPAGRAARRRRAGLHHGDDVRFRRAGGQAAAIILQHCADTGRSLLGLDTVGLGAAVRRQRRASSSPRSRCRPSRRCDRSCVALAYLLGGFTTSTGWARSTDCTWPA